MVFYDLGKVEAVCPGCETKQVAQAPAKQKRTAKKAAGNYRRPLKQRAEPVAPAEDDVSVEPLGDDDEAPVDVDLDS